VAPIHALLLNAFGSVHMKRTTGGPSPYSVTQPPEVFLAPRRSPSRYPRIRPEEASRDTTCATFLASDSPALFSLPLSWACSLASALTDTVLCSHHAIRAKMGTKSLAMSGGHECQMKHRGFVSGLRASANGLLIPGPMAFSSFIRCSGSSLIRLRSIGMALPL
jgi:hypothetical protein